MKRCWLGAGILVLLLVLGLVSAGYLARVGEKMSREIEQAALTAADPDSGRQILGQVRRRWEKIRFALAVFSDHAPASPLPWALILPLAPEMYMIS